MLSTFPGGELQEADGAVQMRARRALWGLRKGLPWSSSYKSDLGAGGDREREGFVSVVICVLLNW